MKDGQWKYGQWFYGQWTPGQHWMDDGNCQAGTVTASWNFGYYPLPTPSAVTVSPQTILNCACIFSNFNSLSNGSNSLHYYIVIFAQ